MKVNLRLFALCILGVAFSACQSSENGRNASIAAVTSYQLSKDEALAIAREVRSRLKEPTSAIFGDLDAAKNARGVVTVCGLVNSRNSFGGYTGNVPYIGVLGRDRAGKPEFAATGIGDLPTGSGSAAILALCREQGIIR